jgi:hypothetical protein
MSKLDGLALVVRRSGEERTRAQEAFKKECYSIRCCGPVNGFSGMVMLGNPVPVLGAGAQ